MPVTTDDIADNLTVEQVKRLHEAASKRLEAEGETEEARKAFDDKIRMMSDGELRRWKMAHGGW